MADVLIIDESLTVRMDLRTALEGAGYTTALCANIQAAQRDLLENSCGLIILDVLIAGGPEFLRELRTDQRTASIPVMVLSTEAEVCEQLRGRQGFTGGADTCVGKPYDRNHLLTLAGELLRRQQTSAGRPTESLAGRRILAIDDSATYLHELAHHLRQDGICVATATRGEEALQLLSTQPVDCILLDLVMPGLSGVETCRRIKNSPAWRGIPVLMLTGLEEPDAMVASFGAGADDFIPKSGDFAVLKARLRLHIRRKQFEEENQRIREQLQQREIEAKAAELASQSKDHFLAVLSHELRTPLTPVLATASMLESMSDLSEDVRQSLEVIRRNVELEARLIDDLLDLTRIARGKVELDQRPIELCTIIRRAVEVCQPDIEARRLEFGVDLGPAAPHIVHADAARLQQVFWNLIKNAIKFTPEGGCVGIRCRREDDGHVVVEVHDSGEGIAPELLPRLFNAFEQGERRITRQFGGLGLGLAISKTIVELHGGTISAHSEGKGKGATFRIRLPMMADEAKRRSAGGAEGPAAVPGDAQSRPLRILLVEDHGDTARILKRLLTAGGHEVQTAGDVATAQRLAGSESLDLLISDLGLPDGTGVDLMRELRRRGIPLPGIALSGYGQEEDVRRSKEAGFAEHLTKPVDFQRLASAIAQVGAAAQGRPSGR